MTSTMSRYDRAEITRSLLPQLAVELTDSLGKGWSRADGEEMNPHYVLLAGPNSERLSLGVDNSKPEHVDIAGWLPREIHDSGAYVSDLKTPHIAVAVSRGPATVAREIERRLMPPYRTVLAEAFTRAERVRRSQKDRDAAVELVAELLRQPVPPKPRYGNVNDSVTFHHYHRGYGSTRIIVKTGGTLEIEISGDAHELVEVVAALGKVRSS